MQSRGVLAALATAGMAVSPIGAATAQTPGSVLVQVCGGHPPISIPLDTPGKPAPDNPSGCHAACLRKGFDLADAQSE